MENPVYRHSGEIAFADTDASGWMHFPSVFHYVEAAEHAFLKSRDILVFARGQGGWPRVKVGCEFKKPFVFGDRFEVVLGISRIGGASISWAFEILNAAGEIAAFGQMTNVRVDQDGKPQLISEEERERLMAES